jgi:HNH endonuclease
MKKPKVELTVERLRDLIAYDSETGLMTWRRSKGAAKGGSVVGGRRPDGYMNAAVDGVLYLAHRLIWFYVTGSMPTQTIDHANGVRNDNRFANLREATYSQNSENRGPAKINSVGVKGVSVHRCTGKWQARIKHAGLAEFLGVFESIDEARAAYTKAAFRWHGEFARIS